MREVSDAYLDPTSPEPGRQFSALSGATREKAAASTFERIAATISPSRLPLGRCWS